MGFGRFRWVLHSPNLFRVSWSSHVTTLGPKYMVSTYIRSFEEYKVVDGISEDIMIWLDMSIYW